MGLNELVENTSSNTDRVATLSQTLQEDYVRLKSRFDGNIDGVPDLLLEIGEAVQLCNGTTSFGVRQFQRGRVWYDLANSRDDAAAGSRIPIGDQGYVDFIGIRDNQAMFKVNCDGV